MLDISTDKVCHIIVKAREFDVKVDPSDPDSGSNPTDDAMRDVLEDLADDPTFEELGAFIDGLNVDEQVSLVALAWIGRGDYEAGELKDAVAAARRAHNPRTSAYLLGLPLLADHLEDGLSAFDLSCEDFEAGHL